MAVAQPTPPGPGRHVKCCSNVVMDQRAIRLRLPGDARDLAQCARARLRPRGRSHVRVRAMACRSSANTRAVTVRRPARELRRSAGHEGSKGAEPPLARAQY